MLTTKKKILAALIIIAIIIILLKGAKAQVMEASTEINVKIEDPCANGCGGGGRNEIFCERPSIEKDGACIIPECNETSVWSGGECKSCMQGYIKENETRCVFSGNCWEGFIYDESANQCEQVQEAKMTCKEGYHLEQLPNRTREYNNKTQLTIYHDWICAQNVPFIKKHKWWIGGIIIFVLIIYTGYYLKKWNDKKNYEEQ